MENCLLRLHSEGLVSEDRTENQAAGFWRSVSGRTAVYHFAPRRSARDLAWALWVVGLLKGSPGFCLPGIQWTLKVILKMYTRIMTGWIQDPKRSPQ